MSSGTFVRVERYFNRYHFQSLEQIEEERWKALQRREDLWNAIKGLVYATPRDIAPHDCDPCEYLKNRMVELREELESCQYHLDALADIEDGWETREED